MEPGDGQERHERLTAMRRPLFKYCMQLTASRWEAEDVVQETMVRLFKLGIERPEQQIGLRYACRTARNLWIDRCRREKRVAVMAQTDAAELAVEGEGAGGQEHAALDVREHLEELAWRLSPKPFVILLLMDVFDFTAKETAAWLGGTEVAVQVALSRARSRLKSVRRSSLEERRAGGKRADHAAAGGEPMPAHFFEAVLDAFRRRQPAAIREAYMIFIAAGGQLQRIRALGGKLYFTFQDPDGNVLMVST